MLFMEYIADGLKKWTNIISFLPFLSEVLYYTAAPFLF